MFRFSCMFACYRIIVSNCIPKITRACCDDRWMRISMRTASAAAQTPVDSSELHQQPVDAVLRPTFVQKLGYKMLSIATFIFIQTSKYCFLY